MYIKKAQVIRELDGLRLLESMIFPLQHNITEQIESYKKLAKMIPSRPARITYSRFLLPGTELYSLSYFLSRYYGSLSESLNDL